MNPTNPPVTSLSPLADTPAAAFDFDLLPESAVAEASQHLRDILTIAFEHHAAHKAVVVYDEGCELAVALTEAYRRCLPEAQFIDFTNTTPADILTTFAALEKSDLVILIQSTNFRLEAYRLRVELFKRGLKVIEHPHLARMRDEEGLYYIQSLAYDPAYYRGIGRALKQKIDVANHAVIHSGNGDQLLFSGKLEPAKLNVGDYSEMTNIGGQFPSARFLRNRSILTMCTDVSTFSSSAIPRSR